MEIRFYKTKAEKNRLTKELTDALVVEGNLNSECDVVNPSIIFDLNTALTTYNYAYIPAFNRYYYITDWSVINKRLNINMHCDVLMSFRTDILTSEATVTRTNTGNKYLPDNLVKQTSKIKRQVKKIGTGFTVDEKYIVQIGG